MSAAARRRTRGPADGATRPTSAGGAGSSRAEFLAWLAVPPGARWLDVGSGTGALTEAVLAGCAPREVVGVEPSDAFRAYAEDQCPTRAPPSGPATPGRSRSTTARSTPSSPGWSSTSSPTSRPRWPRCAARPDPAGTVAAYVWDYAGGMQLMTHFWDAAVALDPAAAGSHEGARFAFCRPDPLRALFAGAGLRDVDVEGIVVPIDFADFDDYWTPFLAGTGPAPAYVASLDDADRAALRDAVRARLPIADDGSIPLTARAWAVRGTASAIGAQQPGELADVGQVEVGAHAFGQVGERLRVADAGVHGDREGAAPVRHRHLELRVVADHGQLRGGKPRCRSAACAARCSDGLPTTVTRSR